MNDKVRWVPGPRKGCMPQAVGYATLIIAIGLMILLFV
jgi:hypothetical protein